MPPFTDIRLPSALTTPEFRLLAACAGWPRTAAAQAAVRACLDGPMDWPLFLALVARHRIGGLVTHALSEGATGADARVPDAIRAELAATPARMIRLSLRQMAEATWLDHALAQTGIAAAFVKGQTLAILAYGDIGIGLRHSRDIDILVAPAAVDAALAVLEAKGYQHQHPRQAEPRFRRARTMYHLTMVHPRSGLVVELHWRLTENPWLMAVDLDPTSWRPVALPGATRLRTLGPDELFLYLCVHGARHAWFRLKWLADIAALAAGMDEAGLNAVVARARARGLIRPVAQALVLANRLLGLPLPAELTASLAQGAAMRFLLAVATAALADPAESDDETGSPPRVVASHYLLRGGARYWLAEMLGDAVNRQDWETVPLPERLSFLYPLLRLPLWLWRRLVRPHVVGRAAVHDVAPRPYE